MTLLADNGRVPLPPSHIDFSDLAALESDLLTKVGGQTLLEEKLRGFFRSAIDEVIDTARSGRCFFHELEKTEKTYLGTKFEILLRDWLEVPRGVRLDLVINGQQVDVKSTTSGGYGWMIPPEAVNELCILLSVNELTAKCSFGLARARREYLRPRNNRDSKTSFSAAGRGNIWWMVSDFPYTPNFWGLVSLDDRMEIMPRKGGRGGAFRLSLLFEKYQEVGVSRVQIIAVGAQDDPMRRVRRDKKKSGARAFLAPKGIAILYSEIDQSLMRSLGLKFGYREFMSYTPKNETEASMLRLAGHIV